MKAASITTFMTPVWAALVAVPLAVTGAQAQGTPAQRAACTPDALRLCSSYISNVGAVTACMRRERSSLSPACRTALDGASPVQREAARRVEPRRVVAEPAPAVRRGPARLAARPAYRVAVRPAPSRYGMRQRPVRHAAYRRGYGGDPRMRQAAYWLQRLGGIEGISSYVGAFSGGGYSGGLSGASLGELSNMRVGDLVGMLQ